MSLVDIDSWQTEYDGCVRLYEKLSSQLERRTGEPKSAPEYGRLTTSVQTGLKRLDVELLELKAKLDASNATSAVAIEETHFRRSQLETLRSQLHLLATTFNNMARSNYAAGVLINNDPNREKDGQTGNSQYDVVALKQRQIEILEDQNRDLETLSQTLSRQRELATQLGREVEDQNDIIENLANTIGNVETRVTLETGNISQVNRQDSTCWYWTVILLLFAAIILVAVL